jgi:hypothetical protein
MAKRICKHCNREFYTTKKYINSEYCGLCRTFHKKCAICQKEIFVQARTCSKQCAYELRKLSWRKTCGSDHNFCRKSSSRIQWEKRLLEEGITNVWQREEVKEKSRKTLQQKFNIDNVTNVSQIPEIKEKIKKSFERKGYWNIDRYKDEYAIYICNVWQVTHASIKKYWDPEWKKENKLKKGKDQLTVDHKYSISKGFKDKISPEIMGSIVNLEILTRSKNSSKGCKCSLSLNKLMNDYNNFIDENKIN